MEGGRRKREGIWGYMYKYSRFTLLYSSSQHNNVKQLYSNKVVKKKKGKLDQYSDYEFINDCKSSNNTGEYIKNLLKTT